jgi:hypothetical protein
MTGFQFYWLLRLSLQVSAIDVLTGKKNAMYEYIAFFQQRQLPSRAVGQVTF